jgi:hypothetical protein
VSDHPPSLIVLFTADLRANFELLPHVSAMIQRLRSALLSETAKPVLILDLGGVWDNDSWECLVTENRAPYLVLDAMGYAAANADGLDVDGIMGLQEAVQMRLLENTVPYRWQWRDITVNIGPKGAAPCVTWAQSPATGEICTVEAGCLQLYPQPGALGLVEVSWPELEVLQATAFPFNWDIRPDPSIVACVEFVQNEAKAYAERQSGSKNPGGTEDDGS